MTLSTDDLAKILNEQHAIVVKAAAKTDDKIGGLEARLNEVDQKMARRGGPSDDARRTGDTLGSLVVNHADFASAKRLATQRGKVTLSITTAPSSGGALAPPDRRADTVALPQQRLTVRDLLSPGETTSNLINYARQSVRDLNAGVVSEGALKPQSDIAWELVDAPVRTIAHWVKASRQVLDDAPQLRAVVDSELRYGLGLAEEVELLYGDGTGQHILGIVPQADEFDPPFAVQDENALDTLLQAIAQVQLALLPASGVVLNDMDWKRMLALKDSEGRYLAAGPFGSQLRLAWTVPVVDTPSMPAGQFLVGAMRDGAQIFDRMEKSVLLSTEDGDNFIRNMVTVLAEERLALTVRRPQAFVYGTFPSGT